METAEAVRGYVEANKDKFPFNKSPLKNVTWLPGGYVNFVYRLEFEDNSSVILKNYPRSFSFNKNKNWKDRPPMDDIPVPTSRYFAEKVRILFTYYLIYLSLSWY